MVSDRSGADNDTGSVLDCTGKQRYYMITDDTLLRAYEECLTDNLYTHDTPRDGLSCPKTFDCLGCWPSTPAGKDAIISCPDTVSVFNTELFATKTCTDNGTWYIHTGSTNEYANYSACPDAASLQNGSHVPIYVFLGGYILSIVTLALSLGIFVMFRQLRCDRITLHKNLFVSFILNGILWILYYIRVTMDAEVMQRNPLWCQLVHVFCQYFTACNFSWMFCEGFYLHTVIVVAFHHGKTLLIVCILIGWVCPLLLTTAYAATRLIKEDAIQSCWVNESNYQWIIYGPIVASLLANFTFLINIIRVILTKLRAVDTPDSAQTKKAVRATLILVPLLGLQYILLPFRPEHGSSWEEIYLYAVALITSLQGALVALIYCFLNSEVMSVLRRRWNQIRVMRGRNSPFRGMSGITADTMTCTDAMAHTIIQRDVSEKTLHIEDGTESVEMQKLMSNGSNEQPVRPPI